MDKVMGRLRVAHEPLAFGAIGAVAAVVVAGAGGLVAASA